MQINDKDKERLRLVRNRVLGFPCLSVQQSGHQLVCWMFAEIVPGKHLIVIEVDSGRITSELHNTPLEALSAIMQAHDKFVKSLEP